MIEFEMLVKKDGLQPVAARLGVRYQAVQAWLRVGRIPPMRAVAIEREFGLPRERLRPDLWPPGRRSVA